MRNFHVKAVDCIKDIIKLNRRQTKPASLTSKRHLLVKCAMIYGCSSSTESQIPTENKKAKNVDHFMMN